MTLWLLGGTVLLVLAAGIAVQVALARNAPAVLDTLDQVTGSSREAAQLATVPTGAHPQQKVVVWGPAHRNPTDAPLPVLVFAHGGAWRDGDPVDYGFIGRAFVPEGFIVVLSGYRLGAEGRYPAMLEDTASAVAWTHKEIAAYGGDPNRIVLAGHSAGAYNVVMVALEEQWLGRRGVPKSAIAGVIGIAGPYDFVPFAKESTIAAFGHTDNPAATQPMNHVRADAPQMLLVQGEKDDVVRPRNARVLAAAINAAGGHAIPLLEPQMDHNRPLISLAAPFRRNSDMLDIIAGFAHAVAAGKETSVPVQDETR